MLPDSLMVAPCGAIPAGKSVQSLTEGYIHNTTCLYTHQKLLEQQRQYKKQVEKIYGK